MAIDSTSIPYFQKYIHKDFNVEYLLFVASQYGTRLINVYAFGSFPEGYDLAGSQIATLPEIDMDEGIGPAEAPEEGEGSGLDEGRSEDANRE